MENAQNTGRSIDFGPLMVDRIEEGMSEGSDLALLKQGTTTAYAAARGGNDKTDSLFGQEEFGEGETYNQDRYTLIKVPAGSSAEDVQARIEALDNPVIYRILSLNVEDVLTDDQKSMLAQGLSSKTLEEYKEDKAVKFGDDHHETPGEKILFNGQVQYKGLFFSKEFKQDVDLRQVPAESSERMEISSGAEAEVEERVQAEAEATGTM